MVTQITEILERLYREFPAVFVRYEERRRPLKIGIHVDIAKHFGPAINRKLLWLALRTYTNNAGYLRALKPGAGRIDLAGEPCGAGRVESPDEGRRGDAGCETGSCACIDPRACQGAEARRVVVAARSRPEAARGGVVVAH
jgi:sRNA-binding protein